MTLGDLFDSANAANLTGADGKTLRSQVDKRTLQGTTLTYLLTAKVDKKAALKATIKFTIKVDEDTVTMTSIKVTDAMTGKFSLADFDGSMNSLGRILGIFSGVANMFVDVDKVNAIATNRQQE